MLLGALISKNVLLMVVFYPCMRLMILTIVEVIVLWFKPFLALQRIKFSDFMD